jgi:hypothetical protein
MCANITLLLLQEFGPHCDAILCASFSPAYYKGGVYIVGEYSLIQISKSRTCGHTHWNPSTGKAQAEDHEFEVSLSYIVNSMLA